MIGGKCSVRTTRYKHFKSNTYEYNHYRHKSIPHTSVVRCAVSDPSTPSPNFAVVPPCQAGTLSGPGLATHNCQIELLMSVQFVAIFDLLALWSSRSGTDSGLHALSVQMRVYRSTEAQNID